MTPSFTPGPWTIAQYISHEGFSIWASERGCIAERWYPSQLGEPYATELLANARLIVAAPEMYELLADRHVGGNVWEDRINDLFRRIAGEV